MLSCYPEKFPLVHIYTQVSHFFKCFFFFSNVFWSRIESFCSFCQAFFEACGMLHEKGAESCCFSRKRMTKRLKAHVVLFRHFHWSVWGQKTFCFCLKSSLCTFLSSRRFATSNRTLQMWTKAIKNDRFLFVRVFLSFKKLKCEWGIRLCSHTGVLKGTSFGQQSRQNCTAFLGAIKINGTWTGWCAFWHFNSAFWNRRLNRGDSARRFKMPMYERSLKEESFFIEQVRNMRTWAGGGRRIVTIYVHELG